MDFQSEEIFEIKDADLTPVKKLVFFIIETGVKKNFKEFRFEVNSKDFNVICIGEDDAENLVMVLQPEAKNSFFQVLKVITNWKGNIPIDKQVGKRRMRIEIEGERVEFFIIFSFKKFSQDLTVATLRLYKDNIL